MAIRDDFAPGEILVAADLNDTFLAKADYNLPVDVQSGTTYTFTLANARQLVTATSASAKTFTIPPQSSVTWAANSIIRVVNYGAGALTINGGVGVTVTNTATTVAQFQSAAAIRTAENAWTLVPFSGGAGNAADFSNTATGTYTDGSGLSWKYLTFSASGTLNISKTGLIEVLVAGGGGAGGTDHGGGGGAGGFFQGWINIAAGSYTCTIGAGGSPGPARGTYGTNGVQTSLGSLIIVPGGGVGGQWDNGSGGVGASGGGGASFGTGGLGAGALWNSAFTGSSGRNGANGNTSGAGGGGGYVGNASNPTGGAGVSSSITGSSIGYVGGGGGADSALGSGASRGGNGNAAGGTTAGAANSGSGGGGNTSLAVGGAGGSGVVIVRVRI